MTPSYKNNIELLNEYFDKIYILTLPRATERHLNIQNNLIGLNFTFFYGTDKLELDEEDLIKKNIYDKKTSIKKNRYYKPMKLGEIACSMGHKAIYEDAVLHNYSRILILEDDVIFNKDGLNVLDSILNQLPSNWDVLYFDYFKNEESNLFLNIKKLMYQFQRKIGLLNRTRLTIKNLFAKSYSRNLKISGYHDYASAYAITLKAAKVLIELQSPIIFPADHVLPYAITNNLLNGFISIPKVFEQQSQSFKDKIGSYVEN
jgi:glycosyl transferase family 25